MKLNLPGYRSIGKGHKNIDMKTISFLTLLFFTLPSFAQVIAEEEFSLKVKSAQENCQGAHESIVQRTNEELANFVWGKSVRFNNANIEKFYSHPGGEKVVASFDVNKTRNKNWAHVHDMQIAADLLTSCGLKITPSYNTKWISAKQDLIYAKNTCDSTEVILELYCPPQFLEFIRTGRKQSIEFMVTGIISGATSPATLQGVVTKVHTDRQIIKCSNGHEYDKIAGYKFCPKCGEALK